MRLFGEELFAAWSETIARAALYTLTDEHIRHGQMNADSEVLANRRYSALVADA